MLYDMLINCDSFLFAISRIVLTATGSYSAYFAIHFGMSESTFFQRGFEAKPACIDVAAFGITLELAETAFPTPNPAKRGAIKS